MTTTGSAPLPDVGKLAYNGVEFTCLFKTDVTSNPLPDEAGRTNRCVEHVLTAEGVVTLNAGIIANDRTTDVTFTALRQLLSAPGGMLTYQGKGFGPLVVNAPGGSIRDIEWGPKPKVLTFQPLGASRSAMIRWQVVVRIPELASQQVVLGAQSVNNRPVVQFNYGASTSYSEDGYASFTLRGTLEIPLTRGSVSDRTLSDIVDNYRQRWLDIPIDLTLWKITRRSFDVSRDKRKIEWEYAGEEQAPMPLPLGATKADGEMTVGPVKLGMGLVRWSCTLRCNYTISPKYPRRLAAYNFYNLLWSRMRSSLVAGEPLALDRKSQQSDPSLIGTGIGAAIGGFAGSAFGPLGTIGGAFLGGYIGGEFGKDASSEKPVNYPQLINFGFTEGVYEDSRSMSFHATWLLTMNFQSILAATGVWRWSPTTVNRDLWAASMKDLMGWKGCVENRLNPDADIIVDMGGGAPLAASPTRPEVRPTRR